MKTKSVPVLGTESVPRMRFALESQRAANAGPTKGEPIRVPILGRESVPKMGTPCVPKMGTLI